MRSIVATGLSLVGVLGAGALAAGANLQVFDDQADTAPAGSAIQVRPTSSGDLVPAERDDAVGVQTFRIGEAGTITLDASGGLHVVGIDPAPGWRAEQDDDAPAGAVLVEFETEGDRDLDALAVLGADGIEVSVRPDGATEPGVGERHGDDDGHDGGSDDRYEDDRYEDDD